MVYQAFHVPTYYLTDHSKKLCLGVMIRQRKERSTCTQGDTEGYAITHVQQPGVNRTVFLLLYSSERAQRQGLQANSSAGSLEQSSFTS